MENRSPVVVIQPNVLGRNGNGGDEKMESGKNLQFDNIRYHVFQGRGIEDKFILKGISGCFSAGHLSAIMGPSGAGKSSLMNVLAGYRIKNVSGNIYINNLERDLHEFRKLSCYIMQNDLLLPHLSVEEAMMCSASLKLSEKISTTQKRNIIKEILNKLSLGDAAQTRTSKLSGGQRKRLAIAQELVNNPPIMFFDEPTSGLDSAACYQCISLLRSLARDGRTVICTIHQPSAKIFEMFDYLYFLAEGYCIYRGPVTSLVPYLAKHELICPSYHNPADYFMEVACGEHGENVLRLASAVTHEGNRGLSIRQSSSARSPAASPTSPTRGVYFLGSEPGTNQNPASITTITTLVSPSGEEADEVINIHRITESEALICSDPGSGHGGQSSKASAADFERKQNKNLTISEIRDENGPLKPGFHNPQQQQQQQHSQQRRTFETSMLTQFRVLYVRSLLSILRDSTLTHLRLVSHVVVGLLIGLLYFRIGNSGHEVIGNAAFIFFSLLFIMFAALMPTVMTFPIEMSIFIREHMNYWYSLKMYYLAKSLADVPFQIIFPIIYCSLTYWMTEQPADFLRFFLFVFVAVQTSLVGQSLGLVIGAATSLQVAVFLGPVTGIPILLFSGFFISLDLIPKYLQWLSYMSFTRYSFAGTIKVIYGLNRTSLDCTHRRSRKLSFPCPPSPESVVVFLDAGSHHLYIDVLILCAFFLLLRILCYFILRWRIKSQR